MLISEMGNIWIITTDWDVECTTRRYRRHIRCTTSPGENRITVSNLPSTAAKSQLFVEVRTCSPHVSSV